MSIIKMTDIDLLGKRVLIRSDFNVPIKNGVIISDAKIRASLPTIDLALRKKSKYVIVASHLGRPVEGECDENLSLYPVFTYLKNIFLQQASEVLFIKDYLNGINDISDGALVILENVRFNKGEKNNDESLAKQYATLCDVFIMDAFAASHRTQSSTHALAKIVPDVCSGLLLHNEIEALSKALHDPKRPMVAIVGGSKVSTKLTVLDSLSRVADYLIVGGGIANTFLAAQGKNVGKSLYESELIPMAQRLLENCDIPIPIDVWVSTEFSETASATLKVVDNINDDEQILDLGNRSISHIVNIVTTANTILWNGPLGVFEFPNFRQGTELVAKAIVDSQAFSIAGGGDTLMAIDLFGISNDISYISTGGGAFLEFIEGKQLPSISVLER
ncbi:phosphoglycerate kinase [Blochmannia endosymbiont of Polyrhachis (Hedomyrma) turneri]|uniref:phosphoglycerate kinase n=1 Tax=Blochmannia endosymbiont of Polyrhachis (Hedomyrma) turneri TaxID=1505596 RepID=UPI00061A6269|nr:phosphoglycerate kinase [Blochmannia endosymbiont of Polyrhachis (Hedomyrma) turneri]AKC59825.1 Phosphoglycerate kinase [Blochmannia endosymbiont of Polyrhachis (Hedomyrma) turneri]